MATFTGTFLDETITPTVVSPTVIRNPFGSFPSGAADFINGVGGNDNIAGGGGSDTLLGGDGNDTLNGDAGNDSLDGGAGFDIASYTSATAAITVSLALSGQQKTGGAGNDTIDGGNGLDTVDGGDGIDTVLYQIYYGRIDANLDSGSVGFPDEVGTPGAPVPVESLVSIENLLAGSGNDTITGSKFANVLDGGSGDDVLAGDSGNDILVGQLGNDTLDGGDGNDILDGGTGIDTVTYTSATWGVTVSLAVRGPQNTGDAGIDTLINIENLLGSAFNDTLSGGVADNLIAGAAGDDTLFGDAGNDSLDGEANNDSIDGGKGDDVIKGGDGDDALDGSNGNDAIGGSAGNDTLIGGQGADTLSGDDGDDTLSGDAGGDNLIGGLGKDTFRYSLITDSAPGGADTIQGFDGAGVAGGDVIRLSGIDANTLVAGDQAFTFIGTAQFTHHAGELRVSNSGTNTLLRGDVDGDGNADFQVAIQDGATVASDYTTEDFVL